MKVMINDRKDRISSHSSHHLYDVDYLGQTDLFVAVHVRCREIGRMEPESGMPEILALAVHGFGGTVAMYRQ
jgi:hypothetical protein